VVDLARQEQCDADAAPRRHEERLDHLVLGHEVGLVMLIERCADAMARRNIVYIAALPPRASCARPGR
jgi:hypothetical protein